MAAPVKPGTAARYWREVEGLSRLEIALLRDPELSDEERGPLVAAIVDLKAKLVSVAGVLEGRAADLRSTTEMRSGAEAEVSEEPAA